MGRSRSSPLGRIISRIEPLASGKERRGQLCTRGHTLLSLLFFIFLIYFYFLFFRRQRLQSRDPSQGGAQSPSPLNCTWPLHPRKGGKKAKTLQQQRRKEGAVGAQGAGKSSPQPFGKLARICGTESTRLRHHPRPFWEAGERSSRPGFVPGAQGYSLFPPGLRVRACWKPPHTPRRPPKYTIFFFQNKFPMRK